MEKKSPAPIILLVVGIVLFVGGAAWGIIRFAGEIGELLPQETWVSGSPKTVSLEAGDWAVYELAAAATSSSTTSTAKPTVNPEAIAVTGPDGQRISTKCISCGAVSQSTSTNGAEYLGVVEFNAPEAGGYTITVESDGNTMAVGKPVTQAIGSLFGSLFLAIGLSSLGFLLIVAAVIWLIVRSVNGRKTAVPAGAVPPAVGQYGGGAGQSPAQGWQQPTGTAAAAQTAPRGWYPDAGNPQQLRWWDGTQWTENVKPLS